MTLKKMLVELSVKKTLDKIKREIQPAPTGKNRRQSPTVWKALDKHFGLEKGDPDGDQYCENDSTCFRDTVIDHLKSLKEDDLKRIGT